jgi:hypothetical protein
MKMYVGVVGELHTFSSSALLGGEWPVSWSRCFAHKETACEAHGIWECLDPTACLDVMAERKIPAPTMNETPVTHPIEKGHQIRRGECILPSAASEWSYVDLLYWFTDSKVQSSSTAFPAW